MGVSSGPKGGGVVTTLDELRTLETAHQALFASAAAPHIGTAYPYVVADAATGSSQESWRLFTAYRSDDLAGCLYGRRVRRTVLRMAMPVFEVGTKFVADPLLGPGEELRVLRALIEALQENQHDCAMFLFPRLSVASFDALAAVADELRLPWHGQWARYSYAFDTTCGRDEFLARLDGKYRRELGRRRRRLFRELPCELVREEGLEVDDAITRFEAFMEIEDSGWKGENETSIRRRAGYEPYFRELVRSASRGGQLVWYTLQANRRPIAMYLALRTHDTVWLPKIGYDERFSEHAPGLVMNHDVLLHCIDDPEIRRVDNLSAAPWARPWQPAIVPFRSMTLFGSGVRSQLVYRALAAKHLARRFLGRTDAGPGPYDRPYL